MPKIKKPTYNPLPKTVMVGGTVYEVSVVAGLKDPTGSQILLGQWWGTKPLIEIEADIDISLQWQVLWHELMHAFLHNAGLHGAHDEQIIEAVSTQINWVLVQNGQNMMPTE